MRNIRLNQNYSNSHALIIGINNYIGASPLLYAVNDANAVRDILKEKFEFPENNIITLLDNEATKSRILSEYLAFVEKTDKDSRLLFYFAGHGCTKKGNYREFGFLFPYDGNSKDLSSLIDWQEITNKIDLIPSKHIFFVMDACYGGLALNRALSAGSIRYLKDMMQRTVRQVITAGKDDEPVSDGNGPLPKHSVFTGYFIKALENEDIYHDECLTATGVMSYVYKMVSNDNHSYQTPMFGYIDGDGEFFFRTKKIEVIDENDNEENDFKLIIPSLEITDENSMLSNDPISLTKQYLADNRFLIPLHDLVMEHVRKLIVETGKEYFPIKNTNFSDEEIIIRLQSYESVTQNLIKMFACIAYWGKNEQQFIIPKALSRLTDNIISDDTSIWKILRWYPSILLFYSSGIGALAKDQFNILNLVFNANIHKKFGIDYNQLIMVLGSIIGEFDKSKIFKKLPGYENKYVPRSEYLLKFFQPEFDRNLFLGNEYELIYDRFEIMFSIAHAVYYKRMDFRPWGPIGRFGWKYYSYENNPFGKLINEAKELKEEWPPFKANLFGTDIDYFLIVLDEYSEIIRNLGWS